MRVAQRIDVIACDRSDCASRWCAVGGDTYTAPSWRDVDPVACDDLVAIFCSAECHGKAHVAAAHGDNTWRRRGRPRIGKEMRLRRRRP